MMKKLKIMYVLVIILVSIFLVGAGDVIVKGGDLSVSRDLIVDTNSLYVNSTTDFVGIGTKSPDDILHLFRGDSGLTTPHVYSMLNIEDSNHAAIQFMTPNGTEANIWFGDPQSSTSGGLLYYHLTDELNLRTSGSNRFNIDSLGVVGIGTLAAASGTDYVCVDTNGDLSHGDTCTRFKDLIPSTEYLSNDQIKVANVVEQKYPNNFPIEERRGKIINYFYTILFNVNDKTVQGTIKVPPTLENDDEILYYLKSKIEVERGTSSLVENQIQNNLVDKTFSLSGIKYFVPK